MKEWPFYSSFSVMSFSSSKFNKFNKTCHFQVQLPNADKGNLFKHILNKQWEKQAWPGTREPWMAYFFPDRAPSVLINSTWTERTGEQRRRRRMWEGAKGSWHRTYDLSDQVSWFSVKTEVRVRVISVVSEVRSFMCLWITHRKSIWPCLANLQWIITPYVIVSPFRAD